MVAKGYTIEETEEIGPIFCFKNGNFKAVERGDRVSQGDNGDFHLRSLSQALVFIIQ